MENTNEWYEKLKSEIESACDFFLKEEE
jgi:hypothetical protein